MHELIIPVLYIPTFYGDVRLERVADKETRVIIAKATPLEQSALYGLVEHAVRKNWIGTPGNVIEAGTSEKAADMARAVVAAGEGRMVLGASLDAVRKVIAKVLKPGRELITVVRFVDGKMEEITEAPTKDVAQLAPTTSAAAVSTGAGAPAAESGMTTSTAPPEPSALAKAAATVAKPVLGCPAPNFAYAELRANRVLEAFLTQEQKEDFRKHDCFVTVGAATGHRYMVTSRSNPSQLARFGGRSLYDLEENQPVCTHDWDVPAAEEMLSLHLFASLPQHELYLRHLAEEAV